MYNYLLAIVLATLMLGVEMSAVKRGGYTTKTRQYTLPSTTAYPLNGLNEGHFSGSTADYEVSSTASYPDQSYASILQQYYGNSHGSENGNYDLNGGNNIYAPSANRFNPGGVSDLEHAPSTLEYYDPLTESQLHSPSTLEYYDPLGPAVAPIRPSTTESTIVITTPRIVQTHISRLPLSQSRYPSFSSGQLGLGGFGVAQQQFGYGYLAGQVSTTAAYPVVAQPSFGYPIFQGALGSGGLMYPSHSRPSSSSGGSCGSCCCGCSCEPEKQIQQVPYPVPVPHPVLQPPLIIEKKIVPIITTPRPPALRTTQVIVKETVMDPVTTVLEHSAVAQTTDYRQSGLVSLSQCVPQSSQLGSINRLLAESLAAQTLPQQYQILYVSRNVADQIKYRVGLRASDVCRVYELVSPLSGRQFTVGEVIPIGCPTIGALSIPNCALGVF